MGHYSLVHKKSGQRGEGEREVWVRGETAPAKQAAVLSVFTKLITQQASTNEVRAVLSGL